MTDDESAALPYRRGVGIALFNDSGLVFAGERIDSPGAWQMPQGGIDGDEEPWPAALRELHEEVGTRKAHRLAETGWLRYDLPATLARHSWSGKYRGQEQKWFAARFTGTDEDVNLEAHHDPEFRAWRWIPLADMPELIVPFKRALYQSIVEAFAEYGRSASQT